MKRSSVFTAVFALCSFPVLMWAIPQNIGGFNNNIMQEEKWERPPNYEGWRLDGAGHDGRAPVAGDPKPNVWINTKPVDVLGVQAPAGSARLATEGGHWGTVTVRLPKRESDDFHLLKRTLEAETGEKISVVGEKPGRRLSVALNLLKVEIRELASGELDVFVARAKADKVSAR